MATHPLAGKPAPYDLLVNVPRLISAYYTHLPDPNIPEQQVAFGTSGHRSAIRSTNSTFWRSARRSANFARRTG
jgi:hypothetical protein